MLHGYQNIVGKNGVQSHHNQHLTLIRDALELALDDRIISESPAAKLKWRKPAAHSETHTNQNSLTQSLPIFAHRNLIVKRRTAQILLSFLGWPARAAEASSITRADVDLDKATIRTFRHKTESGFEIPIYPQLRPLIKRLCKGKTHNERILNIKNAKKALTESCKRLGFPGISRSEVCDACSSLRAIELGVDVKVISQWQGHRDGGKLILATYSHVRPVHSQRMARLMR